MILFSTHVESKALEPRACSNTAAGNQQQQAGGQNKAANSGSDVGGGGGSSSSSSSGGKSSFINSFVVPKCGNATNPGVFGFFDNSKNRKDHAIGCKQCPGQNFRAADAACTQSCGDGSNAICGSQCSDPNFLKKASFTDTGACHSFFEQQKGPCHTQCVSDVNAALKDGTLTPSV